MALELGVYTFGNTPRTADGGTGATAQAVRDALEAVRLADEVGLDFFGFGEHHTASMPLSSPTAMVNAAAASTRRIKLGTTVTVLSTDEPLRVFEQLGTAAAIAPGRIETVAGRGSSPITFPLFDFDENDYDMLYASKLDLLIAANSHDRVTWSGPHRQRPLVDAVIVPRPEQPLRIWLGTGGSPESVLRAVETGLPMFLGILGGTPQHWAQYGHAYRDAWAQVGHPAEDGRIAVAVHGFVVTATSGHLGRLVVRDLLDRSAPAADIVAGARNLDAITDLAQAGVRTAVIDYNDPSTLEQALSAGDTLVLVSGNDLANRGRQHADAVAVAAKAGVGHLVYTSGLQAAQSPNPIAASHTATENVVRDSGVPYTLLRNGWYTENYARGLDAVRATGVLLASVGDGRVASATRHDFAGAIGAVVTNDGHLGRTYELSGDVAWSYHDLAAALAELLGRDVTYQSVTGEEHVAALTAAGVPDQLAAMAVAVDAGIRASAFAYTNGDLARLIGAPHPPPAGRGTSPARLSEKA